MRNDALTFQKEDTIGKFIVFEGISSRIISPLTNSIARWMRNEGVPAYETSEPTGGPIGAQVTLTLTGRLALPAGALASLIVADRIDHWGDKSRGICHDLSNGMNVICIRYSLSDYAYQNSLSLEWLVCINRPCPWPDLMIFVDSPVEKCMRLLAEDHGHDDEKSNRKRAELTKVRSDYLRAIEQCEKQGNQITMVDGSKTDKEIFQECQALVCRVIEKLEGNQ